MADYEIDLPSGSEVTRNDFDTLPGVPRLWEWELRSGRLTLSHMLVTGWHSNVVMDTLAYWRRRGHEVCGRQYVADGAFLRGEVVGDHRVVDAVAFRLGHRPDFDANTHDAADIHVIIEVGSSRDDEREIAVKRRVFEKLGVPNYWIIRDTHPETDADGTVTMYELVNGVYKLVGTRLVSQLKDEDSPAWGQ